VINVLCGIRDILLRTDEVERFNKFAVKFLKNIKDEVGWECKPNEGMNEFIFHLEVYSILMLTMRFNLLAHTVTLLRGLVMSRLITHGDQEIIDECVKRFTAHEAGSGTIPADLRACAYRSVLSQGDAETLDLLLNVQ